MEGSSPWFLLGYAAIWGKAEQPPASEVESPRNRALRGDKAAADMDPVHCKACECQTAGSSHRLPPGPAAAIPFPPAPGELRVRDPWLLAGGHSCLGFGQIMGFLLGGTGLPPLPKAAWGVALDSRESKSVFCSWPDHLAGAFTPGSPPRSSRWAFNSPAGSPAMTPAPPSPRPGAAPPLPLRPFERGPALVRRINI